MNENKIIFRTSLSAAKKSNGSGWFMKKPTDTKIFIKDFEFPLNSPSVFILKETYKEWSKLH